MWLFGFVNRFKKTLRYMCMLGTDLNSFRVSTYEQISVLHYFLYTLYLHSGFYRLLTVQHTLYYPVHIHVHWPIILRAVHWYRGLPPGPLWYANYLNNYLNYLKTFSAHVHNLHLPLTKMYFFRVSIVPSCVVQLYIHPKQYVLSEN